MAATLAPAADSVEPLPLMVAGRLALPLKDAADCAGIGLGMLRKAIDRGELPVHYVGTKPIVHVAELNEWILGLPDSPPTF